MQRSTHNWQKNNVSSNGITMIQALLRSTNSVSKTVVQDLKVAHVSSESVSSAVARSLASDIEALAALSPVHCPLLSVDVVNASVLLGNTLQRDGRMLFTSGVGKSGHVASRLASSLTSVSLPCRYVHATEWLHGELGLVRPGDSVILFSHSGATKECTDAAMHLVDAGANVVGVIGNRIESQHETCVVVPLSPYCTQTVSYFLSTSDLEPFGKLPTCSIVVQTAVSNALLRSLMHITGKGSSEFHANHPGGVVALK